MKKRSKKKQLADAISMLPDGYITHKEACKLIAKQLNLNEAMVESTVRCFFNMAVKEHVRQSKKMNIINFGTFTRTKKLHDQIVRRINGIIKYRRIVQKKRYQLLKLTRLNTIIAE